MHRRGSQSLEEGTPAHAFSLRLRQDTAARRPGGGCTMFAYGDARDLPGVHERGTA